MMQETYKVITDLDALNDFIAWLPDLEKGECYYGALLARNKYTKDLGIGTFNSDRHQCGRFLSLKQHIANRIWRMEAPMGSYTVKGFTVPQEALAFYLNINPRNHVRAQPTLIRSVTESVLSRRDRVELVEDATSAVRKTIGRKIFVDIDVDGTGIDEILKHIKGVVNVDAVMVVQTRGGFHIVFRTDLVEAKYRKSWYPTMMKLAGVDVVGDTLLPVPGTIQGGFTPVMKPLSYYL